MAMSTSEMKELRLKKVDLSYVPKGSRSESNSTYVECLTCASHYWKLVPHMISFNSQITSIIVILDFVLGKTEAPIGSRVWAANPGSV